ncbi:MAG: tetratricopeptide repeat protein, partial [Ktedonobacteraceae bacterium]|nr:tetratricopeptide repeat protein [Ktedonobacteraceae bacterium]
MKLDNEAFLTLLERNGQDEEALLGVATTLDSQGHYEGLVQMADVLLNRNPSSAQGLAFKARALQKLERFSEATIANDQALLLDTNLPLAWINRSGLQLLQKKFPEALRSSQRAIELAPNDARAWANRGVALLNFGHLLESLAAFDKSLEHDSSFLFALQMKSEIFTKLGRMSEVVETARQALHNDPSQLPILIQLVRGLRALESYEQLEEV